MGVVIVGPSGAGKSTLLENVKGSTCKTGKVVKQYTMNPKAMPRHQLLGHIDMDTREWSDGVLTNSARQVVREPQGWSLLCDSLIYFRGCYPLSVILSFLSLVHDHNLLYCDLH